MTEVSENQTLNLDLPIQEQSFTDATEKVITAATNGNFDEVQAYATHHLGPGILLALIGLGIIFVGYLVAKYLSRVISAPICRKVDETLGRFVGKAIFYTVLLGVTGAVLSKMGAPLGGLAAMLAAAGFAVGLAFQGTLSNFASGVLMLVFRPFKVGDFVEAGGVSGTVNEIDLFTTTLDTPDNRRIIVPNSAIAGGTIENKSFHADRRLEVTVGVDYSADLDQTRAALETAIQNHTNIMVSGDGRGGAAVLAELGDSAVVWKVRLWVHRSDYWPALESLTGEVKRQLDASNIGIPFPQMDIHLSPPLSVAPETSATPRNRPQRREVTTERRAS